MTPHNPAKAPTAHPSSPLVSAAELLQRTARPADPAGPHLLDVSFDLTDPQAGESAFIHGHIPGARYVHLDRDLSVAKNGRNGRHPLPTRLEFAQRVRQAGISPGDDVVVYDRTGGMFAVRLWWMLRWVGLATVRVLDGGLTAWERAGGPLEAGSAPWSKSIAEPLLLESHLAPSLVSTVDRATLLSNLEHPRLTVLDARSADRYRGENETLDPVAGHIPGARHRFFKDNLQADGCFKSPAQLREEFAAALGRRAQDLRGEDLVMQCGSGVTACHNLLALECAGVTGAALYPGSWSEWCADPSAPVATGPQP